MGSNKAALVIASATTSMGSNKAALVIASATGAAVALIVSEVLRRLYLPRQVAAELIKLQAAAAPPSNGVPRPPPIQPPPVQPPSALGRKSSSSQPPSPCGRSAGIDRKASREHAPTSQPASARGLMRQNSHSGDLIAYDESLYVAKHTEDSALRVLNVDLMERGHAPHARAVGQMYGAHKTKVIRICLTGGPCAGKSSALEHLCDAATREGFDVLTAPEVATLYFNSSYQFPNPNSDTFGEQKFTFQRNILKLQLQMERCYSDLAGSTGRPTIVVFDRGLRDCRAFMAPGEWPRALEELNLELPNGPSGRITDQYTMERYDGIIHLVTAADGAPEFYKFGVVEDDTGGKVFRRETPSEAIEQDQRLQEAWRGHKHHVVVENGDNRGFHGKLEEATNAVLAIARLAHPGEARRAKNRSLEMQAGSRAAE